MHVCGSPGILSGLSGYARDRDDAAKDWPRGVSRLSAYLHHGHVSPFRIAREAAAGGEGSVKFLDELLVWRELAFNFCFFTDDPESLAALPAWARATLGEHAQDTRPRIIDGETLSRSGSGDEVWDLAQTSLRIHGELHNNLRMTWAKAIPTWRPDPQVALDTLVALNHRYALDALWDGELCLGVCGDWCRGARIEDAFLSGHAVAGRILGYLAQRAPSPNLDGPG